MRILHISTYNEGGAANSLYRLHKHLIDHNIDSKWLVLKKSRETIETYNFHESSLKLQLFTFLKKIGFRLKLSNHPFLDSKEMIRKRDEKCLLSEVESYHLPTTDFNIMESQLYQWADIIHLHWVAGFLDYPSFFKANRKPVVWTLHDRAPFSGGLHYCEYAAILNSSSSPLKREFSQEVVFKLELNKKTKAQALKGATKVNIVSPSNWLREESKKSFFLEFPHYLVPYGIPDSFCYHSQENAREELKLPKGKFILLFVADNLKIRRKGFQILIEAILNLDLPDLLLCSVGNNKQFGEGPYDYNKLNIHHFGKITDEQFLAQVYASADFFVIPSLEDNLPNTVLESLCCGTPVLGFDVGGISEMINPYENGILTLNISPDGLKDLLILGFENRRVFKREGISNRAKMKYSLGKQELSIIEIYEKAIS